MSPPRLTPTRRAPRSHAEGPRGFSAADRALIEAAVAAGKVTRVERAPERDLADRREPSPLDPQAVPS